MYLIPDRVDRVFSIAAADCDVDICVVVIFASAAIYIRGMEICTAEDNPYNDYWERQFTPAPGADLDFIAAALGVFSKMKLAPAMLHVDGHLLEFIARAAGVIPYAPTTPTPDTPGQN